MLRHDLAIVAASLALLVAAGVARAQEGALVTRAERTAFRETSRYADVVAFLEALAAASPDVHLLHFGYSWEGRALPLAIWDPRAREDLYASPHALRRANLDRTRVLVFANIHAGEVEGKEAAQILLRDLVAGLHPGWADSLLLMVAPIYNADGNERIRLDNRPGQAGPIGGMGQRPNAQGLDLNRDFTKLESPEARSLVALLRDADPHVVVDLHTTDGTWHGYHLTYAPPLHPDTDPGIDRYIRETWLPTVTRALAEEPGRVPGPRPGVDPRTDGAARLAALRRDRRWSAWYYGNLPDAEVDGADDATAPRGWYTYDPRPRFSTNYVGLRNRFGILSEAYSHVPFDERIAVTLRFVEEVLDFAASNAGEIRRIVEAVDARSAVGEPLALAYEHAVTDPEATILLGDVEAVPHPYTGEPMLLRKGVQTPERMPEYGAFRASETDGAPAAFLVPAELEEAVEILEVHGIRAEPLEADRTLVVEAFRISASSAAEEEFQGHRARSLEGEWVAEERAVPAGTLVVSMDQPLARLAWVLLEPRSDDGLVRWNLLDDVLEGADTYPILRVGERLP